MIDSGQVFSIFVNCEMLSCGINFVCDLMMNNFKQFYCPVLAVLKFKLKSELCKRPLKKKPFAKLDKYKCTKKCWFPAFSVFVGCLKPRDSSRINTLSRCSSKTSGAPAEQDPEQKWTQSLGTHTHLQSSLIAYKWQHNAFITGTPHVRYIWSICQLCLYAQLKGGWVSPFTPSLSVSSLLAFHLTKTYDFPSAWNYPAVRH